MNRKAGFTLIELLCALAILGLVLGILLRMMSGGLGAVGTIRSYSQAVALAQSRLSVLMAADRPPAGERHGMADGLAWTETVLTTTDAVFADATAVGLAALAISVRVTAKDGREVRLRSIKLVRSK